MTGFSISAAVAEPFRQAFKRPLATLIWGLVMLLPTIAALAIMWPAMAEISMSSASHSGETWDSEFATMMQFQAGAQLANVLQLVASLFIATAIIRAVFASKKSDRSFFLRAGMDELHVAVVAISIGVGVFIAVFIAILIAVALGAAFWGMPEVTRSMIYIAIGIALFVGFLLLWGRLALLAPASIKYSTFAFVEGWKLGRGQTWRLLGLLLVLVVVAIAVGIVLFILFMVLMLVLGGTMAVATELSALETWSHDFSAVPLPMIVLGVVMIPVLAWLQGFSTLLFTAPFARVVEDLAEAKARKAASISADTTPDAL